MGADKLAQIFKIIIGLKVFGILLFVLVSNKVLVLGERGIQANPASGESASGPQGASVSEPRTGSGKKRQGFLEGLLDLPALSVETSHKDEIGRYLSLAERAKQQVEDRLQVLNRRATQLQSLEKSIDEKLYQLDEEKKYFASTIQREKEIQQDRLTSLVDLYSNMEPKKAAPIFEGLDKDLAVAIFKKMKNKQVTRILEAMPPEKSLMLTEYFGRIGSAREYDLLKEMNRSMREAFNDCKGLPKESSDPATQTPPI